MKTIVEIPRGSGIWFTFDNSKILDEFREKLIAAFQAELVKILARGKKRKRK